jgi:hypothetical protein
MTQAIPDDAVITRDAPCAQCGYNLRTLPVSGKCPECGLPIMDTYARISRPGFMSFDIRTLAYVELFLVLILHSLTYTPEEPYELIYGYGAIYIVLAGLRHLSLWRIKRHPFFNPHQTLRRRLRQFRWAVRVEVLCILVGLFTIGLCRYAQAPGCQQIQIGAAIFIASVYVFKMVIATLFAGSMAKWIRSVGASEKAGCTLMVLLLCAATAVFFVISIFTREHGSSPFTIAAEEELGSTPLMMLTTPGMLILVGMWYYINALEQVAKAIARLAHDQASRPA